MFKLLCTDLDETLLTTNKTISERNLNAIKKAVEKGVKVVVCTGRPFGSARYYAEILGLDTPIISANGSYIRKDNEENPIYKVTLGVENCRKILDIYKRHNITPHFHGATTIYTGKIIDKSKIYFTMNDVLPEGKKMEIVVVKDWEKLFKEQEENLFKCIAIDDNYENIREAREEIDKMDDVEVASSLRDNFEITGKNATKGKAVEFLTNYYNIKKEEVICIGDNENDISMINFAGLGVAVKNGEEEAKNAADFITDTNNNDGVAKVIEKFIL